MRWSRTGARRWRRGGWTGGAKDVETSAEEVTTAAVTFYKLKLFLERFFSVKKKRNAVGIFSLISTYKLNSGISWDYVYFTSEVTLVAELWFK